MPHISWSPRARSDLARLRQFLVDAGNRPAADRAVKAIRGGLRHLTTFPESGHRPEGLPPDYREWVVSFGSHAYVVLYRYRQPEILIAAVRHSREAGYRMEMPSGAVH